MPGPKPTPENATPRQRTILERWMRRSKLEKRLHERASLIIGLLDGLGNHGTAHKVGVDVSTVAGWRKRWKVSQKKLADLEQELDDKALAAQMASVLSDAPGRGRKPKFTSEQVTMLIKLATTPPKNFKRPISHWTPGQLADEAAKQGIVSSISPRQVGRFLKSGGAKATSHQVLGDQP